MPAPALLGFGAFMTTPSLCGAGMVFAAFMVAYAGTLPIAIGAEQYARGTAASAEGIDPHPERNIEAKALMDIPVMLTTLEATGRVTLMLPSGPVELEMQEFEVFAPGQKFVEAEDENGNWVKVADVTARSFRGHVAGAPYLRSTMTLDAPLNSIFGTIRTPRGDYDLQTPDVVDLALAPVIVGWRADRIGLVLAPPPEDAGPHGDGAEADAVGAETLTIKPHADTPFVNTHANSVTRINQA